MAPVTVIGLGAMGGALAGVLLERGHELTVCSRSGITAARGADPRPGRSLHAAGVAMTRRTFVGRPTGGPAPASNLPA